jgi:alkanesulfonate monooxygenase SsuD/methylene tetrahydromethanopterin reductase-like flavin-dependent oxidoreductase (luciferase family)
MMLRYSLAGTLTLTPGGRAEIGVGAAWNAEEHEMFGFGFPPPGERLALLEEATRTIATLWNAEEPVSLDGRYPLRGAALLPRPVQRPAPILIGGGSLRAVDIAARWATGWNGTGDHAVIASRIATLREREVVYGREGRVETSVMLSAPETGLPALLARLAQIGVQRIVLSTPRPWHPAKLEALASAVGL